MEGNVIGKTFNVCLKLKREREKEKRVEGDVLFVVKMVWML